MATCINLRQVFGGEFRVALEPPAKNWSDPWHHVILCRYGHIYPHGDDILGYASDRRGPLATRIGQLPGCRVVQDGEDGTNVIFPVAIFSQVEAMVHPRRRRRLSPEQRARLLEVSRQTRFPAGAGGGYSGLKRVATPQVDSGDQGAA